MLEIPHDIPHWLRRERKNQGEEERPYREFDVSLEHLEPSEKRAVGYLKDATKIVGEISDIQKDTPEFSYPADASDEELIAAFQNNDSLRSPYTRVIRKPDRSLSALPYHQHFKVQLADISRHVNRAADATTDPLLKRNLHLLSEALINDRYQEQELDWVGQRRPTTINAIIGPKESYNDEKFSIKGDYLAAVGILNEPLTDKVQELIDWMVRIQRQRKDPKITARVDDTLILAGAIKDFEWTACTYPNDPQDAKNYGSKITIFNTMHKDVVRRKIIPTIKAIFTEDSISEFSDQELSEASLVWLTLHEGSHPLASYPDETERLRSYYHTVNELQCSAMGLSVAYQLYERRVLTHKQLEMVLAIHLARIFVDYGEYELQEKRSLKPYALGSVINFDYWWNQAELKPKNGKLVLPDPEQIIGATETLTGYLDYHARASSFTDVKSFVNRHDNFRRLSFANPALKPIFPMDTRPLVV